MNATDIKNNTNSGYSIYHDLMIKASIDTVFESITDPDHLVNWWPLMCSGTPKIGSIYNFYFEDAYNWYGKVINIIPNTAFHIKMTDSDSDWNPTSFGFDLEEIEHGVQLRFWHVGWPECNAHFKRSSFCWAMLLNGLKNYIEQGIIIPFKDRD